MKAHSLYAADVGDTWNSFGGGTARMAMDEPADYCSREGALNLKTKIEAYWRERGQDVMLSLHNVGFHPAIRAARFDVRSDMINGLPRAGVAAVQTGNAREPEFHDLDDDENVWIDP